MSRAVISQHEGEVTELSASIPRLVTAYREVVKVRDIWLLEVSKPSRPEGLADEARAVVDTSAIVYRLSLFYGHSQRDVKHASSTCHIIA